MDIDIRNLGLANVTREQVKAKFANDPRLEKILTIFDNVEKLGEKENQKMMKEGFDSFEPKPGVIDDIDIMGMRLIKDGTKLGVLDNNHDGNVTDWELSEYFSAAKESLGGDIELEDYRKFLGFIASEGNKAMEKEIEGFENKTGMSKELIDRLGGPYRAQEFKLVERDGKKYYEFETDDGFKEVRDVNGKLLEHREADGGWIGYEDCESITTYDENGETSTSYINHKTGEMTKFEYGKNPGDKSYKLHVKDGVAVKQLELSAEEDPRSRNVNINYQLEDIVFGAGTPDSTKVSFKYDENNKLAGIDIKDETLEEDKPRGFTTDGEVFLTHVPKKKTSVSSSTVEAIKSMLDGGARYGEDFDLKIVDGELKVVPKIKNETGKETPELKGDAFDKYKDLVSKGVHQKEDFEVEYDENGNFRYTLRNNQAREFDAEYKNEVYDKDGNFVSSMTVKNGEVISEKMVNGKKQLSTMKFEDAFMEMILVGDFSFAGEILGDTDLMAGGYNIYKFADEYKEKTGRELILDVYDKIQENPDAENVKGMRNLLGKLQPHGSSLTTSNDKRMRILENYQAGYNEFKELLNFDPYKSQVAGLLPKIERIQNGENAFTETVNNDKFDVKVEGGKLNVSKNDGKQLSIDISKIPPNYVKNIIMKINSSVLYDIASTGTQFKLNENMNRESTLSFGSATNGYYDASSRSINIDPNLTIGNKMVSVISHECGHMRDFIDDKDNAVIVLKERLKDPWLNFNQDKPVTLEELLEKQGTFQPSSVGNEKLNEAFKKGCEAYRSAKPNINSNAAYCTTSPEEFFAEAYALLTTGHCKSEYVIAKYMPEALECVKELMEQNRARHEIK